MINAKTYIGGIQKEDSKGKSQFSSRWPSMALGKTESYDER